MRFQIAFHTPFRVATGRAGEGSDTTVDRQTPLPASSLKGVMRSAARDVLRLAPGWVDAVYGTAWQESPWSWSDATPQAGTPAQVRVRARIQIAQDTATVVDGALAIAEEFHAAGAEFTITRSGWLEPDLVAAHEAVLVASARAVTAVGGVRRRGLGWVSITPSDPPWPGDEGQVPAYVDRLLATLAALPDREVPR
ncbi:RAMP superfamily CRISPR-associated protein [Phytohabitans aurantiacus]|uniref:CRISPR type III-associated protein domain-containing protein n=1 Tax=Phytohabitans aurantiacus TaxID=3016789 RepID=A0ABQ5R4P3_9ACTN|nr:RAMP superfamily CRISPR-associated protein [Phytohabitans aurantiacus]GLI00905.1 hypothetical protein Pa4123_61810 [Phytohabitans aurantiacus]